MEIKPIETEGAPKEKAISYQLLADSFLVMGIVNITPDSFYDGGKYYLVDAAIIHAEKLISEGADIIDLGGASSRPGADTIGPEEELKRLSPVLDYLVKNHAQIPVSIDTFHSKVAKECAEKGASIINDISGGSYDKDMYMYGTVAALNTPYVLMHLQGTPKDMQVEPHYNNVVKDIYEYFVQRIAKLKAVGVNQIIIDPGFGFGKTVEHNYALLKNLDRFKSLGFPIMAGISRKSMINKVLKTKPENALTGTIALNTIALMNGANILRVHDVKEAKQVVQLVMKVKSS